MEVRVLFWAPILSYRQKYRNKKALAARVVYEGGTHGLPMARPTNREGSSNGPFRKRIPREVLPLARSKKVTFNIALGQEVRFSLPSKCEAILRDDTPRH